MQPDCKVIFYVSKNRKLYYFCAMISFTRIAVFLYALFILALSLVPCGDRAISYETFQNSIELSSKTTHSQPSPDIDFCTPFCTCVCCATPTVVYPIFFIVKPDVLLIKTGLSHFVKDLIPNFIPFIWQPPRIV